MALSRLERKYVEEGIKQQVRWDGRTHEDFRPMQLHVDDVVPQVRVSPLQYTEKRCHGLLPERRICNRGCCYREYSSVVDSRGQLLRRL